MFPDQEQIGCKTSLKQQFVVVPLVSKLATIQTKVGVLKMQLVSGVTIKHGIVWYWIGCDYCKPGSTGFVCY